MSIKRLSPYLLILNLVVFFIFSVSITLLAADKKLIEPVDIIYIDEMNIIKQRLLAWANSWEKGDSIRYLSFYIDNYAPIAMSNQSWKKLRIQRVNKSRQIKINILFENISLNGDASRAETIFWQDYQSSTYQDETKKKIIWKKKGSKWLIKKELTIK
ncbi:MAG: hypothetical protein QM479_01270 [Pseudomonadota bacterium]